MDNQHLLIKELNEELLEILADFASKLIDYAQANNLSIPDDIQPLIKKAKSIVNKQDNINNKVKHCHICSELNAPDAIYCAYCGTTLDVITRVRQVDSNTRKGDRTET